MNKKEYSTWNKLIYEFYVAGRLLLIKGLFKPGSIQLSYTIEYQMKYLSGICNTKLSNQNKHDLNKIFHELQEKKIIEYLPVTDDFLKYVSFWFKRYPSQIINSYDKWFNEFGGLAMSVDTLSYYDDLVCLLNEEIVQKSKDINNCQVTNALNDFESYYGRIFFHNNYHALSRYEDYVERLKEKNPSRYEALINKMTVSDFIKYKGISSSWTIPNLSISDIAQRKKVINFHMPKAGDPTWRL